MEMYSLGGESRNRTGSPVVVKMGKGVGNGMDEWIGEGMDEEARLRTGEEILEEVVEEELEREFVLDSKTSSKSRTTMWPRRRLSGMGVMTVG